MATLTAVFEGKTPTERNKIIAAGVLGLVALVALYLAFFSGSSTSTTTRVAVTTSPTPRTATVTTTRTDVVMPTAEERALGYETQPVIYNPGSSYAPDPGRNIFAFYEPPPPCLDCPTPTPRPIEPKPPSPAPTPPIIITFANPQSVFAGSQGFRLELNGERFAPDARIYFNQTELPTTFVNGEKLITDIPANLIAQEGPRFILVQTPDGKLYSNQYTLTVEAPPKPGMAYIGMKGYARGNNTTAYFREAGRSEFGARLNDVVGGRFRLVDISPSEVVFEDINLGFRHPLALLRTPPPSTGAPAPARGFPAGDGVMPPPYDPNQPGRGNPPGIPGNIQPYIPPAQQRKIEAEKKQEVDDDG